MILDLKIPSFVLAGSWNPAIFQPSWLARYALDVPEGQDVKVTEVVALTPNSSSVFYFENTGFSISKQRVDVFLNSLDSADISLTETAVYKIVNTLPHTPLGPFGINFTFVENDPDADLLDKLKSKDVIEQHFQIINQTFATSIKLQEGVTLNFSRMPSENKVVFSFNYHHEKIQQANFQDTLPGKYDEYLTQSSDILKKLYDLNDYEIIRHEFNEEQQNLGEQ